MKGDPVFGPAISFGLGGTLVEVLRVSAVVLPPLNAYMAEQIIEKTKAPKYLGPFRNFPPVDHKALINVLLNISVMVSELPEILELDINPLFADEHGVLAVDARITAQLSHALLPYSHMAIHPYPHEMTEHYQLANGVNITIRPIRPEDADLEKDFVHRLSERSKYFRFMQALQELGHADKDRTLHLNVDLDTLVVGARDVDGLYHGFDLCYYSGNDVTPFDGLLDNLSNLGEGC